jgi:hypothetical protein
MPDMNSIDMDDLFKRAAENYPLRTDSADWDKVARALDEDDTDSAMFPLYSNHGNGSRRKYLLLLLLLPLAGIGYYGIKTAMNARGGDRNLSTTQNITRRQPAENLHGLADENNIKPDTENPNATTAESIFTETRNASSKKKPVMAPSSKQNANPAGFNNSSDREITVPDLVVEKPLKRANLPDAALFYSLPDQNTRSTFIAAFQADNNTNLINTDPKQS